MASQFYFPSTPLRPFSLACHLDLAVSDAFIYVRHWISSSVLSEATHDSEEYIFREINSRWKIVRACLPFHNWRVTTFRKFGTIPSLQNLYDNPEIGENCLELFYRG